MAYKLQIVEDKIGLNIGVKYENMARMKRPVIEAKAPDGKIVKERTTYQGQVLGPGATNRQWVADDGTVYSKQQLKFYYNGEEVQENSQTKVFTIQGYQTLKNYTDTYAISYHIYTIFNLFP